MAGVPLVALAGAAALVGMLVGGEQDLPSPAPGEEVTVVNVVDGDTFDVRLADGGVVRVRPPQFDAPEIDECGYSAATARLEALILGRSVRLYPTEEGPDRDRHGRLLRAAEIDGEDVGRLMVQDGYARWLSRFAHEDLRLAAMYQAAEDGARQRSAGLWSDCGWGQAG